MTVLHVAPAGLDAATRQRRLFDLSVLVTGHAAEASPPLRAELREGDTAREVLSFASAGDVDAIVLGSRPHDLTAGVLFPPVSQRIARAARCSVLAVGDMADAPPATARPSDILCAIDFRETSAGTFRIACALAHASGARLMLLHVIDPWRENVPGLAATARRRLDDLAAERLHTEARSQTLVSFGLGAHQIAGVASLIRADLIVLGARSTRAFGRRPVGSTAAEVLRLARRPVLLAQGGGWATDRPRADRARMKVR